jgi:predicted nucleotide-binding protein (sugar kinase/HSP70/actin superfamily)
MGNVYIALAAALKSLGAEVFVPPYNSKKTLNLGSKYSPETVCLPYKFVMGNYLEALEAGTEALLMISAPGTCRLGEYSETVKNALIDKGAKVKFINLDLFENVFMELYLKFGEASGNKNPVDLVKAIILAIYKLNIVDKLDASLNYYRAREMKTGSAKKIHTKALKLLDEVMTLKKCREVHNKTLELFCDIELNPDRPILNLDLTGEIYVVIDHFSNLNIEDELGKMGVHVHRKINISEWLKSSAQPALLRFSENHGEKVKRFAREFLIRDVGGDALESIGDAINAKNSQSDGVIHLLPFTCMPEIISQNILNKVAKEKDIPVLSLIMDEFTGKAGLVTRLEAFVDLAKRRKLLKV